MCMCYVNVGHSEILHVKSIAPLQRECRDELDEGACRFFVILGESGNSNQHWTGSNLASQYDGGPAAVGPPVGALNGRLHPCRKLRPTGLVRRGCVKPCAAINLQGTLPLTCVGPRPYPADSDSHGISPESQAYHVVVAAGR
jgi:hypothetical protein